jgi:hypothetical protein
MKKVTKMPKGKCMTKLKELVMEEYPMRSGRKKKDKK